MNLWTRSSSPTRQYRFATGERPRWVWDPQPGRTYISGEWGVLLRALYRIAIFLGWRPVIPMSPPDPWADDGLLGSRVPRRPPDSSGSAVAAVAEPRDGT